MGKACTYKSQEGIVLQFSKFSQAPDSNGTNLFAEVHFSGTDFSGFPVAD
jgi:hypothetical protein